MEKHKKPDLPLAEKNKKKRAAILAAKDDGNRLLKEGDLETALAVYERGALICNGVYGMSDAEYDEINHFELLLNLNISLVKLKQKDYLGSIQAAKMAMQSDSKNVKARYRIGLAYMEMGEPDESRKWLMEALELSPKDSIILARLHQLDDLEQHQRQTERKFAQSMRGRLRQHAERNPGST